MPIILSSSSSLGDGEQLIIDPTDEATGTEQAIVDNATYWLLGHAYPTPELDPVWVWSANTEGERLAGEPRYKNRTITATIRVAAATNSALLSALEPLTQKIAKLCREKGTLRRTLPSGDTITFDVETASIDVPADKRMVARSVVDVSVAFTCKPFGRLAEVTTSDHTETTLPYITWTESAVTGDVDGLVDLIVDNDGSTDMWGAIYSIESSARYDLSAATAAVFYEAEALTPLGGAATAAGPTGAYGSGSNVIRHTSLPATGAVAILSTQVAATSSYLTHVGTFRVFARIQVPTTNTGTVSVALEYAHGDLRSYTRNATVELPVEHEGRWLLVNLGLVHLDKPSTGAARWDGRIVAWSTEAGDDIDIDQVGILGVDRYGVAQGVAPTASPSSFTARDEFDQSGALTGQAAPTGGTWTFAYGDATDYAVGSSVVTRATTGDTSGRGVYLSTSSLTAMTATVDMHWTADDSGANFGGGLLTRWVDASNWLAVYVNAALGDELVVVKLVAGASTTIARVTLPRLPTSAWMTLRAAIDTSGRLFAWYYPQGSNPGTPTLIAHDAVLATGGALATGTCGLFDINATATACTRSYDNFAAWALSQDAAAYAGQSLAFRTDVIEREDSSGTVWSKVRDFDGFHPTVPVTGQESDTARIVVRALPHPEAAANVWLDGDPGDVSARLTYTPRVLSVPQP